MTTTSEQERIRAEYSRRARQLPADRYSLSSRGHQFIQSQLWRALIDTLARHGLFPLNGKRVLDIGCGRGDWMLTFVQWGADPRQLAGIDLIPERVAEAQRRLAACDIRQGDASQLPWDSASFDLVTQLTVFSSVLDPDMRAAMAGEVLRVLRPGGSLVWYDCAFNNPQNPSILGLDKRCVRNLFPGCAIAAKRVTLAPPLARAVAPVSWSLALSLEKLPFLRSHLLAVIQKP